MPKHLFAKIFFTACLSCITTIASANLLINPTRVHFGANDRTADVTLINTSQTTNTYRITWSEKKALEKGGYEDIKPPISESLPIASTMIRYSPRQVTLKPGERQIIKLAIRRPQNLAAGEYRSHLLFKALAPEKKDTSAAEASRTIVNILLSFAIPVVIVQGPVNYQVDIQSASLAYNAAKNDGAVTVVLKRSGQNSVIGNITAYWTPTGGTEVEIGKLGDFNFWPELNRAEAKLGWVGTKIAPSDGKLRIVYEGAKEFRGTTFFDKTFDIKRSMITTAN